MYIDIDIDIYACDMCISHIITYTYIYIYIYTHMHTYMIYIYIYGERERERCGIVHRGKLCLKYDSMSCCLSDVQVVPLL